MRAKSVKETGKRGQGASGEPAGRIKPTSTICRAGKSREWPSAHILPPFFSPSHLVLRSEGPHINIRAHPSPMAKLCPLSPSASSAPDHPP